MDEIGGDKAGFGGGPAGHGAVAAHGVEGVEEGTVKIGGDAALDSNDLGNGGHGVDLVEAAALAAIHRAHDEDGDVGERGAEFGDREAEFWLVLFLDEAREGALVGAVVDDDECRVGVAEFGGPGTQGRRCGRGRWWRLR